MAQLLKIKSLMKTHSSSLQAHLSAEGEGGTGRGSQRQHNLKLFGDLLPSIGSDFCKSVSTTHDGSVPGPRSTVRLQLQPGLTTVCLWWVTTQEDGQGTTGWWKRRDSSIVGWGRQKGKRTSSGRRWYLSSHQE